MAAETALQTQALAADPGGSAWLVANAGSGKTRVLIDRVARLLLAGTPPARILCLTYTKAAATEMQNRLFQTLGRWAMLDDAPLTDALHALGAAEAVQDAQMLARARRLFAAAIETPGGLKIQTIHAFCASLLRRFPLEAGVSPGFAEADDRAAEVLRAEIVEEMADTLAPEVMARLARQLPAEDLAPLTATIARRAEAFGDGLTRAQALALMGQPPTLDAAALGQIAFDGTEAALLGQVLAALPQGSTNDQKAAAVLAPIVARLQAQGGVADIEILPELEGLLLYSASAKSPFGAKVGKFPTGPTRTRLGPVADALDALMLRVEAARGPRLALQAAEHSVVLHDFATVFLHEYRHRKALRGWLDFDDLIRGAQRLLSTSPMAQWVLYRLDGGIDHILVDEAQDTAPGQWVVIDRLAQEMLAGEGARGVGRTVFVVGDKKQSIYSFQGADLAAFDAMQAHFRTRLSDAPLPLREVTLRHSFRSAPAILAAVDATFATLGTRGTGGDVAHTAFFDDRPGRVDLWPALEPAESAEKPDWTDPVDSPDPRGPVPLLAEAIAAEIAGLIAGGAQIPTRHGPRPVHAGDFLILVQRRGPLFHALIRCCKAAGIDVAGADRLRLGGEVAVRDLTALMSFLATPDDDLSLAVSLRSPLFGWDEAMLFDAAHGRDGTLWDALRRAAARGPGPAAAACEVLHDLRDRADFLRPYELLERALTRHGGRMRLIARLGVEAEDGIDQLLAQALAQEAVAIPDLTGFLQWLETGETEVRRQPDGAGRKLRVMTVHGAKGLQAPIVILPDTADRQNRDRDPVVDLEDGVPGWKMPAGAQPEPLAAAVQARGERAAQERLRLLYVAMTRAEVWLIVAAAGAVTQPEAWHGLVSAGLEASGAVPCAMPTGPGLRLSNGTWPEDLGAAQGMAATTPLALPDWTDRPAQAVPQGPAGIRWIRPSGLGGAKIVTPTAAPHDPNTAQAAMAEGSRVHHLLEHLAGLGAEDRALAAARLRAADPTIDAALDQVLGLLENADILAALMPAPPAEALSEVMLTAPHGPGHILGAVDRLVVAPDRVLALDFKTNRDVPNSPDAVPEGILRQMGAYRAALRQIWPDRPVGCAVVWTQAPARLMPLPDALVDEAFARAALDGEAGAS